MPLGCFGSSLRCLQCIEVGAKLKRMNAKQRLVVRLLISFIFGLVVTSVALSTVGGVRSRDVHYEQKTTRSSLARIDKILAKYRAQNNRYPRSLNELELDWTTAKDGWRRDWIYSIAEGKPLVESLGRDGKRGGIGTNSDLSNRVPRPPQTQVPFWMRVREDDARMMIVSALVCGLFASLIMLGALEKTTFAREELYLLVPALSMALLMAIIGAAFITLLHVPTSGH